MLRCAAPVRNQGCLVCLLQNVQANTHLIDVATQPVRGGSGEASEHGQELLPSAVQLDGFEQQACEAENSCQVPDPGEIHGARAELEPQLPPRTGVVDRSRAQRVPRVGGGSPVLASAKTMRCCSWEKEARLQERRPQEAAGEATQHRL